MLEYTFRVPGYKLWDYESKLAEMELEALVGVRPRQVPKGYVVRRKAPLPEDQIKRLTFFHLVEVGNGVQRSTIATNQGLVETAAKIARAAPSPSDVGRLMDHQPLLRNGRKESQYATHGLHRYKGKFYPQLVKSLINHACVRRGQVVLDPFVGCGTTLVECYLEGIDAIGVDLHPLAVKIARTRVGCLGLDLGLFEETAGAFLKVVLAKAAQESAAGALFPGASGSPEELDESIESLGSRFYSPEALRYLRAWFAPAILWKVLDLQASIAEIGEPVIRDFFLLCASDILREVSEQEPRQLRIRRRAQPLNDAPVYTLFLSTASGQVKQVLAALRLITARGEFRPKVEVLEGDARFLNELQPKLGGGKVDLMVTSPPYVTALPYLDTDRLSLVYLGLIEPSKLHDLELRMIGNREIGDRSRQETEREFLDAYRSGSLPTDLKRTIRRIMSKNDAAGVGFRRRNMPALIYKYFMDMRAVLRQVKSVLRRGGLSILIVGNNRTRAGDDWVEIKTIDYTRQIGEDLGFKHVETIPITVTGEDLAHAKNLIRENSIIILRS